MAAITHAVGTASTTNTNTYTSGAFTPVANDLLVAFVHASGTLAPSGNMSDTQSLGWTEVTRAASRASADITIMYVANALASATSMTVTFACPADAATGAIITVERVSGMTRTGAQAVRQSVITENHAIATPALSFSSSALTANPTFGAVSNATSPATMTPPTSWTELMDLGYATPTTGLETVGRASGFTGTTITWGNGSASAYSAIIAEMNTAAPNFAPTIAQNTADASSFATGTPALEFTATDSNGDDVQYEIQIDTVNTFDSTTAPATPTLVQTIPITNASASPSSGIMGATTAGNMITVAATTGSTTTGTVTNVTDSQGNTYTKIFENAGTNAANLTYWRAYNIVGGANTVQVTFNSTSFNSSAVIREYTGVTTTDPLDKSAVALGSGTAADSGATATTTQATELVVGVLSNTATSIGFTPGSGYGNFVRYVGSASSGNIAVEDKVVSSTGAQNATFTAGSGDNFVVGVATFKAGTANVALLDKYSATAAGFTNTVNGADTQPFMSAQKVSYTVQSALTGGTYYWRVRAIDPSGSNTYSSWSATRSFTIATGTTTTKTQTGKARITAKTTRNQTGKANLSNAVLRNQTGKANIITNSLQANLGMYYKFDENTGSTVADSKGVANGTWQGTLGSQWTIGKINSAGNFNGTDNYVDAGNPSSLANLTQLTISAWVYMPTPTVNMGIVSKWDFQTQAQFALQTGNSVASAFQAFIPDTLTGDGSNFNATTPSGVLVANTWTHVVMVFDGSQTGNAARFKIYTQGTNQTLTFVGTAPASTISASSTLKIGKLGGSLPRNFAGKIDEVGIWTRALTSTEVTNLYNAGAGTQYPFSTVTTQRTQTGVSRITQATKRSINGRANIIPPGSAVGYYYMDAHTSLTDTSGSWTNDANVADSDMATTFASTTIASGGTLDLIGSTAPTTGGAISSVQAIIYYKYANDAGIQQYSPTLVTPSGGWTWAILNGIETAITQNGFGSSFSQANGFFDLKSGGTTLEASLTDNGSFTADNLGTNSSVNVYGVQLRVVYSSTTATAQSQTGKARIEITTPRAQTGRARLTVTTPKDQTGRSRVTKITPQIITGQSRITVSTPKVQTGRSRITVTTPRLQTGKARLTQSVPKSQTGVSRIQIATPRNQTGISRLTNTTPRNQTGVANLNSPLFSSLSDDFNDNSIGQYWDSVLVGSANPYLEQNGGAYIQTDDSGNLKRLRTVWLWNLTGNSIYWQYGSPVFDAAGAYHSMEIRNATGVTLAIGVRNNQDGLLHFFKTNVEVGTPVTYDPVAHRFLRFRESAGTIYIESASSPSSTWTVLYSGTTPGGISGSRFQTVAQSGTYANAGTPVGAVSSFIVDNVNIPITVTVQPQTGRSRLEITTPRTQTGRSRIGIVSQRMQTGLGRVLVQKTVTISGQSKITAQTARTLLGKARITAATPKPQTGVTRITITTQRNQTGIARLTITTQRSQTGRGRIEISTLRTQTGRARIQFSRQSNQTGRGSIQLAAFQAQTGIAKITAASQRLQQGRARITVTTARTVSGQARLSYVIAQDISGVARIETTKNRKSQTGKARITATTLQTITGLARITITTSVSITGLSRIQFARNATQVGISRITASTNRNITGVARISLITQRLQTGRARISIVIAQDISGRARITATTARIQTGRARVTVTTPRTITGTARITITTLRTITGVARIQFTRTASQTGIARITVSTVRTQTGKSRITATTQRNQTGQARITIRTAQDISGRARITVTTARVQLGKAAIRQTVARTQTGIARITYSQQKPQSGISRINTIIPRNILGISRITASSNRNITGIARILNGANRPQTGQARITVSTQRNQTGLARITATTQKAQTGRARITVSTLRAQTGRSRLTLTTTQIQLGKSRITVVTVQNQTGRARISIVSPRTITGRSSLVNIATRNQFGKAKISVKTQRSQQGRANLGVTTYRFQTGVSRIIKGSDIFPPVINPRVEEKPRLAGIVDERPVMDI